MENDHLIIRETGTHYTIHLPVEDHDLVLMVDKQDFSITIPYFEYLQVKSIADVIARLCKNEELLKNPVVSSFLEFLQRPENKEELNLLQQSFRQVII